MLWVRSHHHHAGCAHRVRCGECGCHDMRLMVDYAASIDNRGWDHVFARCEAAVQPQPS